MSNPRVRVIGTVTGVHGIPLEVGTDHDAVTIGGVQLGPEARDHFARLYAAADEEAKAWAAAAVEEERLDAADIAADRRDRLDID